MWLSRDDHDDASGDGAGDDGNELLADAINLLNLNFEAIPRFSSTPLQPHIEDPHSENPCIAAQNPFTSL